MSRQSAGQSAADFIRSQGWTAGDHLKGEPTGHEVGYVIQITAIGETRVLAKRRHETINGWWGSEHMFGFDSRDWSRLDSLPTEQATPVHQSTEGETNGND